MSCSITLTAHTPPVGMPLDNPPKLPMEIRLYPNCYLNRSPLNQASVTWRCVLTNTGFACIKGRAVSVCNIQIDFTIFQPHFQTLQTNARLYFSSSESSSKREYWELCIPATPYQSVENMELQTSVSIQPHKMTTTQFSSQIAVLITPKSNWEAETPAMRQSIIRWAG